MLALELVRPVGPLLVAMFQAVLPGIFWLFEHRLKLRRILRSRAFLIVVKVDIGRSPRPPHIKQPPLPARERV
jgi:hypothetical protein